MSAERLFLIGGPPGSGKTSVAERIAQAKSMDHLSMGNHLRLIGRQAIRSRYYHELLLERQQLAASGRMPTRLVLAITEEYLLDQQRRPTVLVDGYPRYREQVQPFFDLVGRLGIEPAGLIHLSVPEDVAVQRMLSRGRRDGEHEADRQFAVERVREHNATYSSAVGEIARYVPVHQVEASPALEATIGAVDTHFSRP